MICVLNMPNDLGCQMYVAYALAYVRARLVRDRTFEMDLLSWKQVHEAKDEDQTQETRKAGKQRTGAAKHARRGAGQKEGRPWEAGLGGRIWGGQRRPFMCELAWRRHFWVRETSFLGHGWPLDSLFLKVVHPKPNKRGLEANTYIFISRIWG